MAVHKGYKIFNIRSRVVTKIFDSDVNKSSILNEIERMKKVSQIGFAPSLRRCDTDERCYEEDYVRGTVASAHRSADSAALLKAFYREAVPCMNSLILFEKPVTKNLKEYINELMSGLKFTKSSGKELDVNEVDKINDFVNSIIEKLNAEGNHPVHLVFSHGDFCPANILSTKDGIRIVDWETAGYRSLLFDFYSYFFYRPVNIKISVEKMSAELNQALPVFISGLDLKVTDVPAHLSVSEDVYRRLYYLEYLCKLMERMLTDNRLNIMDYIIRYIEAFSHYEMNTARGC